METPNNAATVLSRLIKYLTKNHDIRNPSASLPKADDYHAFLGRGEDILDALANSCGINRQFMEDLAAESNYQDYVFIDKVYLQGLLSNCENTNLIHAIKKGSGIELPDSPEFEVLEFKEIEDGYIAVTPILNYEIWTMPTRYRVMITMNPEISDSKAIVLEINKGSNMDYEQAKQACQEHYFSLLNAINTQITTKLTTEQKHSGCKLCDNLTDNPNPCCDMGRCEAPEGARGTTNCIHCGGELIEQDGAWYHHSQFDCDELGEPQDFAKDK